MAQQREQDTGWLHCCALRRPRRTRWQQRGGAALAARPEARDKVNSCTGDVCLFDLCIALFRD
jgi:hypothetical protein